MLGNICGEVILIMLKRFSIILLLLAVVGVANAQMEPPAELAKFSHYLGDWTGKGTYEFMGEKGDMTQKTKVTMEGQFLKMVTVSDIGGMNMTETSYVGWDAGKKAYMSYTFTNFAPTPRIEKITIKADGSELWECDGWETGMGMTKSRVTMTPKGDKAMSMKLEMFNDGKWTTNMNIEMVKK